MSALKTVIRITAVLLDGFMIDTLIRQANSTVVILGPGIVVANLMPTVEPNEHSSLR